MKHTVKNLVLWPIIGVAALCALLLITCDLLVVNNAEGRTFTDVREIPATDAGVVLGTTPKTRIGRKTNLFFTYRIDAAVTLFRNGKIRRVIISGDENSMDGVNETLCMKDSLVARGVPDSVIVTDGKGFRTLDSVVRTGKVFGVKSYTLISQCFHNERALYLADHLTPEVRRVVAFNARDPKSNMAVITYIREYFARVKMFADIFTGKGPKTLER